MATFFSPGRPAIRMADDATLMLLRHIRFLLVVLITLVGVEVLGPLGGLAVLVVSVTLLAFD